MNKLGANIQCIRSAEERYLQLQQEADEAETQHEQPGSSTIEFDVERYIDDFF